MQTLKLKSYATDESVTRGRIHCPSDEACKSLRKHFDHDRDRIIHSRAFRRLSGKMQVFATGEDDHSRSRLTHSIEVAQIARTMARVLGVNEVLTEAIALAHDLGHPPFGHTGEDVLDKLLKQKGLTEGFDHNDHTLRLLTELEQNSFAYDGLNLSWELIEGLAKHNGAFSAKNPISKVVKAVDDAWKQRGHHEGLMLFHHASLEAQIAAISDDVAYLNHDIQDGIDRGILQFEAILTLPLLTQAYDNLHDKVSHKDKIIGANKNALIVKRMLSHSINSMVEDIIHETQSRLKKANYKIPDDIRRANEPMVDFSTEMAANIATIRSFSKEHLYRAPAIMEHRDKYKNYIETILCHYEHQSNLTPLELLSKCFDTESARLRAIGHYIASMTDRSVKSEFDKIVKSDEICKAVQL